MFSPPARSWSDTATNRRRSVAQLTPARCRKSRVADAAFAKFEFSLLKRNLMVPAKLILHLPARSDTPLEIGPMISKTTMILSAALLLGTLGAATAGSDKDDPSGGSDIGPM